MAERQATATPTPTTKKDYSRVGLHLQAAHSLHSSTMASKTVPAGDALFSKTRALRSSQMARRVNMISEFAAFWSLLCRCCTAAGHHKAKEPWASGMGSATPSLELRPAQIATAKLHRTVKCSIVSSSKEHRGQRVCETNPRRSRLSAVQHLSLNANHACSLTLSGANECQTCGAPGITVEPSKNAR